MEKNPETDEFITLLSLLKDGVPVGVLAQAIECHGVEGWDQFGRWRRAETESDCSKRALGALAAVYAWENTLYPQDTLSPVDQADMDPDSGSALYFGWYRPNCPDLTVIKAGLELRQNVARKVYGVSGGYKKGERMDLALIGALFKFIKGDFSKDAHPDYKNKRALANLLDQKLDGAAGTADSLEKKLKYAETQLDQKLVD